MILMLLLAAATQPAPLSDLFVNANASCAAGNGSAAAPYCTINEAITAAAPGDVIRVAAGAYSETLVISKDLTVLGDEAAPFVLRPTSFLPRAVSVRDGAEVTIENFEVRGYIQNSAQGVVENFSGDSLVLRNATVAGNGNAIPYGEIAVIRRRPGAGSLLIYGSRISDNNVRRLTVSFGSGAPGVRIGIYDSILEGGTAYYGGTLVSGGNGFVIDGCTVKGGSLPRAVVLGPATTIRNSTIQASAIGIDTPAYGVNFDSFLVEGSTIEGGTVGIRHGNSRPFELRNNIVTSAGGTAVEGSFISIGNNLIQSASPATGLVNGVSGDMVGSLASPIDARLGPLTAFPNGSEVFPLLLDSPAIDAGGLTSFLPFDQRGRLRLAGGADIGAYELDLDVPVAFCFQPVTSAGTFTEVRATGAFSVSRDAVRLTSTGLPPNVTAIFVMSKTLGPPPSPIGNPGVCLGGQIGRLVGPGQILTSDASGRIDLRIDTGAIPQGFGAVPAQTGETWYFQGWHRDVSQGMASFGFTPAAGITFR